MCNASLLYANVINCHILEYMNNEKDYFGKFVYGNLYLCEVDRCIQQSNSPSMQEIVYI